MRVLQIVSREIEIRLDFEIVQNVVQHGAVLAGVDHGDLELLATTFEFVNNYRHLNGFRSGSQYCNGSTFHSTHLSTTAFRHFLSRGWGADLVAVGRGLVGRKCLNPQVQTPTHGQLDLSSEVT